MKVDGLVKRVRIRKKRWSIMDWTPGDSNTEIRDRKNQSGPGGTASKVGRNQESTKPGKNLFQGQGDTTVKYWWWVKVGDRVDHRLQQCEHYWWPLSTEVHGYTFKQIKTTVPELGANLSLFLELLEETIPVEVGIRPLPSLSISITRRPLST